MTSRWNLNTANLSEGVTDAALGKKVKQCYNDIEVDGSNLTLSNTNSGVTKTVVVTGGTTGSINAFNDATLSSNTITFNSTTGIVADNVTVDLASSALANNITNNSTNIASNVTDITTNTTNIATNSTNIATNVTDITTNTTNIATNSTNIATNVTDIATNTANIATNVTDIATNAADISALQSSGGTGSGDSITFNVTASGTSPNRYVINGVSQMELSLLCGNKYIFNNPSGHPIAFSSTDDESTSFTTGITSINTETTLIVNNTFPDTLYYYCSSHSGMGGKINIVKDSAIDSYVSSSMGFSASGQEIYLNKASGSVDTLSLPNSYTGSSITGQIITLSKAVGSADTIELPPAVPVATRNVFYPSTMTSNSMGTAIATASSTKSSPSYTGQYEIYHAFDNDDTEDWVSSSNLYSSSDGSYSGSANLGTNADSGEYLKIDLVNPKKAIALNLKKADNYIKPVRTTISFIAGSGWSSSYNYQLDTTQTTTNSVFYELIKKSTGQKENPHSFGIEIHRESDGSTRVYCNSDNNNYVPDFLSIGSSGTQSTSVTLSGNVGSEVYSYYASGVVGPVQFLITEDLLYYPEAEIKDFKLYGSVYGTNWVQLLSKTNATIANTGTNYTFTNTTDYQYYGLVVKKTNISHNNNVSLGQMSLAIEEVFPVPPCQAKGTFIKPRDSSFTAGSVGTLGNSFNISSITQTSNSPSVLRYGVTHRNYNFRATFTTALTNSNYQVVLSELAEFGVSGVHYGTLLSLSVRTKTVTGFNIHVLADELGITSYNPEFGLDFIVF